MPRCDSCNKFVSLEENDPDVNSLEIGDGAVVCADVTIVNACSECGQDLRTAEFEVEHAATAELEGHLDEGHNLEVEEDSTERTSRTTGKGRGQRTFYGFELTATVTCSCGKLGDGFGVQVVLSEDIQASSMEEC